MMDYTGVWSKQIRDNQKELQRQPVHFSGKVYKILLQNRCFTHMPVSVDYGSRPQP